VSVSRDGLTDAADWLIRALASELQHPGRPEVNRMDPIIYKALGEEHLNELRREAAARRAARDARPSVAPHVPRWRLATGRALVGAGRRVMGEAAGIGPATE
jgi:hypothetical protein